MRNDLTRLELLALYQQQVKDLQVKIKAIQKKRIEEQLINDLIDLKIITLNN